MSSLAAMCTMTLAVGGFLVALSLVYAFKLRPLPYPAGEELVAISRLAESDGVWHKRLALGNFMDLRQEMKSFVELHGFSEAAAITRLDGPASRSVSVAKVTAGLLPTLGLVPVIGRGLSKDAFEAGGTKEVLVAWEVWKAHLGGTGSPLPHPITLDDETWMIVGVLPPRTQLAGIQTEFWAPLVLSEAFKPRQGGPFSVVAFGRLRSGVGLEMAERELGSVTNWLRESFPRHNAELQLYLEPLRQHLEPEGDLGRMSTLVLALMLVVLVAGFANLGMLYTARLAIRRTETSVRRALGAGRIRAIAPILVELLISVFASSVLGVAGAQIALRAFQQHERFSSLPEHFVPAITPGLVALTFLVGALGFGIASLSPLAVHLGSRETLLRAGVARGAGRVRLAGLQNSLIVVQLATSVAAALAVAYVYGSYVEYARQPSGFVSDGVVTFQTYVGFKYDGSEHVEVVAALTEALGTLPGVHHVGLADRMPKYPTTYPRNTSLASRSAEHQDCCPLVSASTGYQRALGIPMLAGRWFDQRETRAGVQSTVLSEGAARLFANDVGQLIGTNITVDGVSCEVLGIAGDVLQFWGPGMAGRSQRVVYLPDSQRPISGAFFFLEHRQSPPPSSLEIERAVASVDHDLMVGRLGALNEAYRAGRPTAGLFGPWLVGLAAGICLVGLTGSFALGALFSARRKREYALRTAVGARPHELLWHAGRGVFTSTLLGGLIGLCAGALAVLALRPVVGKMFPPEAVWSLVVGGALLVAYPVLSLWPAWRAAGQDPCESLFSE